MKRFIFAAILLIAVMTSCSNVLPKDDKCYKVTYTMDNGVDVVNYIWMDAYDVEWQKKYLESYGYTNYKAVAEYSYKTFDDCRAMDPNVHL